MARTLTPAVTPAGAGRSPVACGAVVRWTRQEAVARARSVSIEEARRHFLQKPLTWVGFGVAAVVLAVAGLFGGLEERSDAAAVPPVAIGEAVDAGPWRISVERAFTIDELDGQYLTDEEANQFFGLVATVTVIDDRPNTLFSPALRLQDVDGLRREDDGVLVQPARAALRRCVTGRTEPWRDRAGRVPVGAGEVDARAVRCDR